MVKVKTGTLPFPVPICIAGTMINGKANYATYGSFGLLSPRPEMYIYIGSQESRHTNTGIKENGYFSVNIPSEEQMQKTDYVGLVSGHNTDKSTIFNSFFGSVDKAPMIKECPVNMLCKLVKTADLPNREIFFGEVLESYVNKECINNGILNFEKINPLLFTMNGPGNASYWKLGNIVGDAYKEGKTILKTK
ncbi:flavin reductase family protein [Methanobacterium sp. MBAC-LM]|uniref:flavin reductase family protein n=1 Tax=Methanobacterium sp. MBAC-LM TaxID=3412034 RepID=UPI003C765748